MKKRFFSILLCLCMVLMLFTAAAFADEPDSTPALDGTPEPDSTPEPSPTITIHGADVVCAQQDYEFTVTAAGGATIATEFIIRGSTGDRIFYENLTEKDGVLCGTVLAHVYGSLNGGIELTVCGTPSLTATKTVAISPEHLFDEDGVCECGAKQITITYEFDYGTLSEDWSNPETIISEPSGTSIWLPDLEDCGARQFLGWQVKNSDDLTVYPADEEYAPSEDMIFVAVYDEYITLSVPFTTTVALGDAGVPGETTFDLAVVDANAGEESYADVSVSGSVTTNGAGSYTGAMTFTGPYGQLWYMLSEGAFVQQVDDGEAGWTVDDTVWGLFMSQAELSEDAATGYAVYVVPASIDEFGSYYIDWENVQTADMTFTNTYTKAITEPGEPTESPEPTVTPQPIKPTGSNPNSGAPGKVLETGDNSMMGLWIAWMLVSACGLFGAAVYVIRKKAE